MDEPYVLKKSGMYYAHNNCGYVGRVLLAELYTEQYAKNYIKGRDDIQAIPISECLTGSEEVQNYLDRMEVMRDFMKQVETEKSAQNSSCEG